MRYFFHIKDGKDLPDEEGIELASLQEARLQAVQSAGFFIKDHAGDFWSGELWQMTVADAVGLVLFTLEFTGTMSPAGDAVLRQ